MKEFDKRLRHNRPAATLLKEFCNKKSGKVTDARRELQRRFAGLDWPLQKKILIAHLESGKTDRHWAYSMLIPHWDDCFTDMVANLWEQYHEARCAWTIIRRMPEQYLFDHIEEFDKGNNYYHLCVRLANNPAFVIDKTRLSPISQFWLKNRLGQEITLQDVKDTIYRVVFNECMYPNPYMTKPQQSGRIDPPEPLCITNIHKIYFTVFNRSKWPFDGEDERINYLEHWFKQVSERVKAMPEYQVLITQPIDDHQFNMKVYDMIVNVMTSQLDEADQQKIAEKKKKDKEREEQYLERQRSYNNQQSAGDTSSDDPEIPF